LESHKRVSHIPFDFRLRDESGYRVDHDEVDCAGTNEGIDDFERLFPVIGLGNDEGIDVDSDFFRVRGVKSVFGVDEGARTAGFLNLRDRMERKGSFTRGFGTVDFDDAPFGVSAAEGGVEADAPGGGSFDLDRLGVSKAHDRAGSKLLFDHR
jgi:hypothetical protein